MLLPVPASSLRVTRAARVYTQGQSDPKLGPDDAYPDWLWTLMAPKPLEAELQGKLDAAGYTGKPGPTPEKLPVTIEEVR